MCCTFLLVIVGPGLVLGPRCVRGSSARVGLQAATTSGRPAVLRVQAHGGHSPGSAEIRRAPCSPASWPSACTRSAWTILTDQMQQGGLARARRAGEGDEFTLVDGQVHSPQPVHRRFAWVGLRQSSKTRIGA
jgi:hypothetical protein